MNDPILITGAARSGTSLVAGTINLCGAFGGVMFGPNSNNAKGMFENVEIRQTICKPYLRKLGVDQLGQFPLPDINNLPPYLDLKNRVEHVIIEEGYKSGEWMYKGAKLCLMWPLWAKAFPDAKWVIVRRKAEDIATSCVNTGFMRAFTRPQIRRAVGASNEYDGWLWWVAQHEMRFQEIKDARLQVKEIWPERMVTGDYSQMIELIEWLGLKWNTDALTFVDPRLWKTRRKV